MYLTFDKSQFEFCWKKCHLEKFQKSKEKSKANNNRHKKAEIIVRKGLDFQFC